ncbi:MAG: hypothetical protein ACRCXB_26105 [Aeromonadaceae bacterium]
MTQKHTPEPWATDYRERPDGMFAQEVFDANGETIATLAWFPVDSGVGTTTNREANARRIVACVNACAGLPTEQLEASPLGGVLNGVAGLIAQRDELLAALEALDDCYSDTSRNDLTRSELQHHKAVRADVADIIAKAKVGATITKTTGETK